MNKDSVVKIVDMYSSLTLKQIKDIWDTTMCGADVLNILTGFGHQDTCILCEAVKIGNSLNCYNCPYYIKTGDRCCGGVNSKTYENIEEAKTPQETFEAVKARKKHIENNIL